MVRGIAGRLFLLAVLSVACSPHGGFAQPAVTDDNLSDVQKHGRQLFAQSCGVCHLPPAINARTFGPALSKETAGGSDEIIRGLISEGTPRMPAFKYYLDRGDIDAIIAYLRSVPPAATR